MPKRLITAGYIAGVVGLAGIVNHASESRSDAKLRTSENACLRVGNPSRAVDHLDSFGHARRLREQFEPILDCHRTYFENEGVPVPLALFQQRRYVATIGRGVMPEIAANGVVR